MTVKTKTKTISQRLDTLSDLLRGLVVLVVVLLAGIGINTWQLRISIEQGHDMLVIYQHEQEEWDHFMSLMNSMNEEQQHHSADRNNTYKPPGTEDNPWINRTW